METDSLPQEFTSLDDLTKEIDTNVNRIIDVFRFILKYQMLFRGGGIEFAGLRHYVLGEDDAKRIDWRASLRAKELMVRDYEEERDLDVVILLDSSASMLLGTTGKLKSEYAAIVAGVLVYAGIETGDNVGFIMFNDKIVASVDPSKDIANYYVILKMLVDPRNWGGGANLEEALKRSMSTIGEKSVLFLISDFIGVGDEWNNSVKMAAAKFSEVFGIMILDERDDKIPPGIGVMRLKDPFSGEVSTINMDAARKKYMQLAQAKEEKTFATFHEAHSRFVKVYSHENFVEPLVKYLEMEE
ncbi:Uncharacterised protein [uncultured archaeon]|nr:Uncharacterised protein [uncultured archaeon]